MYDINNKKIYMIMNYFINVKLLYTNVLSIIK